MIIAGFLRIIGGIPGEGASPAHAATAVKMTDGAACASQKARKRAGKGHMIFARKFPIISAFAVVATPLALAPTNASAITIVHCFYDVHINAARPRVRSTWIPQARLTVRGTANLGSQALKSDELARARRAAMMVARRCLLKLLSPAHKRSVPPECKKFASSRRWTAQIHRWKIKQFRETAFKALCAKARSMGIRKKILSRVTIFAKRTGDGGAAAWCSFEKTIRKRTRYLTLGKNVGVKCHPNGYGTLVFAYRNRWTRFFQKSQMQLAQHVKAFCVRNFSLYKIVIHKWEEAGNQRRVKYSCLVR